MSDQKLSILIVDDEQVVRDSLVHWFGEEGYEVESADKATDALSKLAAREFDLVIADIRMPGMDGM
ncbi:MAG TPA: response regulator, partial [Bryobacteraceae bacterium]